MIITIFILIIIIFISVYTNYNLLVKNEKYEDMVKSIASKVSKISEPIYASLGKSSSSTMV